MWSTMNTNYFDQMLALNCNIFVNFSIIALYLHNSIINDNVQ